VVDAALIAIGCLAILLACTWRKARVGAVVLIAGVLISQVLYTEQVYRLLGIQLTDVLQHYGLDSVDLTALPSQVADDPNAFERKECNTFGECYLSRRESISLRHDDQGTFLRSSNEPAFQSGLSDAATKALSGITHPVFWLSASVQPYQARSDLIGTLNTNAADLNRLLASATFVPAWQMPPGGFSTAPGDPDAHLLTLSRGRDRVQLTYSSSGPTYLNAAINHAPGWSAKVNGQPVRLFDAQFGGIMVPLPPGGGDVELTYGYRALDFFFYSRYLLGVFGVIAIVAIVGTGIFRRAEPVAST
jgi:hypothetical protein